MVIFSGFPYKNSKVSPSFRVMYRHCLSDLCERSVKFSTVIVFLICVKEVLNLYIVQKYVAIQ